MEMEDRSFATQFSRCRMEACTFLAYQNQQQSADYQKLARECSALYHKIANGQGDREALLNAFDAAKNALFAIDQDFTYRQGFEDCVYLLKWMKAL